MEWSGNGSQWPDRAAASEGASWEKKKKKGFSLLSHGSLSWTRATTSRSEGPGEAEESMDLEGSWQWIHRSSFPEIQREIQFNTPGSKDKTIRFRPQMQGKGGNPRNSEEFRFHVGIARG